jgi:hypothetical protein
LTSTELPSMSPFPTKTNPFRRRFFAPCPAFPCFQPNSCPQANRKPAAPQKALQRR